MNERISLSVHIYVTYRPRVLISYVGQEIFGPILTVYVYKDAEWRDALKLVETTSPFGLTGAIFTTDQ